MVSYFTELCHTMETLARDPRTMFVGQGVNCAGTTMTDTFRGVPSRQLLEFPVAEDLQMGFCIGLALQGYLPVCIFPRWNFLICATNQIVNHLDRLPIYSDGGYNPRVIIRVAVPITEKFDPGPQHDDDFTFAFSQMFRTIEVVRLKTAAVIEPFYRRAATADHSTLMVEYTALYDAVPSGVKDAATTEQDKVGA